jgi:hypothetical protein
VTVEYCNFYDNDAHADLGVLYGWQTGIIVKLCVFGGNSRDVVMDYPNPARRFEFIGCAFAAESLPADCFEGSTWGNAFGAVTASLPLKNLPLHACQAKIVVTQSASPYFTRPGFRPRTRNSPLVASIFFMFFGGPLD